MILSYVKHTTLFLAATEAEKYQSIPQLRLPLRAALNHLKLWKREFTYINMNLHILVYS